MKLRAEKKERKAPDQSEIDEEAATPTAPRPSDRIRSGALS